MPDESKGADRFWLMPDESKVAYGLWLMPDCESKGAHCTGIALLYKCL